MTNEEIIEMLWQAFKEGMAMVDEEFELVTKSDEDDLILEHERFNNWLQQNYPKLTELPKPRPKVYWHEFGCRASIYTPNGEGACHCEGKHPEQTI